MVTSSERFFFFLFLFKPWEFASACLNYSLPLCNCKLLRCLQFFFDIIFLGNLNPVSLMIVNYSLFVLIYIDSYQSPCFSKWHKHRLENNWKFELEKRKKLSLSIINILALSSPMHFFFLIVIYVYSTLSF